MKQTAPLSASDIALIFEGAPLVRQTLEKNPSGAKMLGRGHFEAFLVRAGVSKRELKQLVSQGVLTKVTTTHNGGWRNTYVLPLPEVKK